MTSKRYIALAVSLIAIVIGVFTFNYATAAELPAQVQPTSVCLDEDWQLESGITCLRLGGSDRYETAALAEGLEFTNGPLLVFANGNGIDALFAADNVAKHPNASLLPLPGDGTVPLVIESAIADYTDIVNVVFLGGRNAIPDETINRVMEIVRLSAGPGL